MKDTRAVADPHEPMENGRTRPQRVIAGLDPAIHPFTKMMDPRVKPAGDG
jgi:hypothetical protein